MKQWTTDELKGQTSGQLNNSVKERDDLINNARAFLGNSFNFVEKSNREIQEEIIKKIHPDTKLDDKSDEYVDGFYKAMAERASDDTIRGPVGAPSGAKKHASVGNEDQSNARKDTTKERFDLTKMKNKRLNMKG